MQEKSNKQTISMPKMTKEIGKKVFYRMNLTMPLQVLLNKRFQCQKWEKGIDWDIFCIMNHIGDQNLKKK